MMRHIYPFQGRNQSANQYMNLLMKEGVLYLMDNHRAAMWCWLQEIDLSKKYNLLHLDAHYDLSLSEVDHSKEESLNVPRMTFVEYEALPSKYEGHDKYKLFKWDNYLALFMTYYSFILNKSFLCTHKLIPERSFNKQYEELDVARIAGQLDNLRDFDQEEHSWIINIDIDFFFTSTMVNGVRVSLLSADMEKIIFDWVKEKLDAGMVKVLTISLSPECCRDSASTDHGWEKSLRYAEYLLKHLGFDLDSSKI